MLASNWESKKLYWHFLGKTHVCSVRIKQSAAFTRKKQKSSFHMRKAAVCNLYEQSIVMKSSFTYNPSLKFGEHPFWIVELVKDCWTAELSFTVKKLNGEVKNDWLVDMWTSWAIE